MVRSERGDGKVRTLELPGNNLAGAIPAAIGGLDQLEILMLRHNNISGELPPEIGRLQKLIVLDCEANELTGEIPEDIGYCSGLEALLLAQNELSGALPETIANLTRLVDLNLYDNQLTKVPAELPPSLRGLGLNHNCLSGAVPVKALLALKQLQVLHLHENDFEDAEEVQEKLEALLPDCAIVLSQPDLPICLCNCTVQ